jgi:hypothetical protein
MTNKERLNAFLKDYAEICEKHGLIIDSCNCCNSPWAVELSSKYSDFSNLNLYLEHLREKSENFIK